MSLYVKETNSADSITTPASKITDLQNQINTLNSALAGKAPVSHNHDDRYYTESELNSLLINSTYYDYKNNSDKFTNFDPSGKFETPQHTDSTGWMILTKIGRTVKFIAALKIVTNFGSNTIYRICNIPWVAYGTGYGIAVSQDTAKTLIAYINSDTSVIYVQTKGSTLKTGDWIWISLDFFVQQ